MHASLSEERFQSVPGTAAFHIYPQRVCPTALRHCSARSAAYPRLWNFAGALKLPLGCILRALPSWLE
jgi:hypothetical protein